MSRADMSAAVGTADRRGPRGAVLLALLGLLLVIGGYDHAIWRKERLLADGMTVRLALAPVDPRALMTGDYMALNYALAREIFSRQETAGTAQRCGPAASPRDDRCTEDWRLARHDGWAVVALDERKVARLVRAVHGERPAPASGELLLRYRQRDGRVRLGTDAWYFQEGSAAVYQQAKFGEFRVDDDGTMVLVRMLDDALRPLGQGG